MKILQLVTRRQYRGAEVFAATLSSELIAQGHEIVFAGLYAPPKEDLNAEGAINVDLCGSKSRPSFVRTLFRLIALLNREKPDIIQANGSDTLKFAVASRIGTARIPIVYRNISIISSWIKSSKAKKLFYQFLFQRIDHVTSVGDNARKDLISFFNLSEHKVTVIHRGIPVKKEDKTTSKEMLMRQFSLNATDKIVIHVGNFSEEKNHKFLVEVFDLIHASNPYVKLIMIGNGPLYDDIQKQISTLQLQDCIFLTGFKANPEKYLAGADLAVLCSHVEGVPGVVLEAAAQKVPVLAVNVGGVSEVVLADKTGILIPTHDVPLFAHHMIKILSDSNSRITYGERAFDLVCTEFDPKRNAHLFAQLYSNLVNDGKG